MGLSILWRWWQGSDHKDRVMPDDFMAFWAAYPMKIGRLIAEDKYRIARKRATAADILAGVERYKANKPDDIAWCHPKTWLGQGRWMDEYEAPIVKLAVEEWFDECKRLHGGACEERVRHTHRVRMDQYKATGT